jgi:hypothetical protein
VAGYRQEPNPKGYNDWQWRCKFFPLVPLEWEPGIRGYENLRLKSLTLFDTI